MRKLAALAVVLVLAALAAGCSMLSGVQLETQMVSPASCSGSVCREAGYEISFEPITSSSNGVGFTIRNTGTEPISVLWDECAFVNTDGQSSRVIHTGVRYSERDAPQAPSMIAPGSILKDEAIPTANVNYYSTGQGGSWIVSPLFRYLPAEQLDGKKAGIYLTLKVGESKKAQQYLFSIKATAPTPAPAAPTSPAPTLSMN